MMDAAYNPGQVEEKIYKFWMDGGFFESRPDKTKKPFVIMMPLPNVTGVLHTGHALNNGLQDLCTRYHRMKGENALYLPGVDHAGIATQIVVEKELYKTEGKSRFDIGREEFVKRVWQWKERCGNTIVNQQKRLGISCDWSHFRFTMDEPYQKAVREVFCHYYEKGLIYRGKKVINWCPRCQTVISDIEVEHEDAHGNLWHIKYPFADNPEDGIIVATTRPETMLGDTAVAVNPSDERYKDLVGKKVILPIAGRDIPIIADEYVDREFGSGAVKITPAHDPNDFEVGRRHDLPMPVVMGPDGRMTDVPERFVGLTMLEARKKIVAELEEKGYLVKIEPHSHAVGHHDKCKTVIEPLLSPQLFLKMKELAQPAIDIVRKKGVRFTPERYTKVYFDWMENILDWPISRQCWWGHRIPIFTCEKCNHEFASRVDVDTCPKCGGKVHQDEDALDTWFSSALWPFATLGWPDKTEDFEYYYPGSLLLTAYDIIFLWVARMIFSGL
ncbi:MAG TPA: valine--tRNA ligase, partial [Caldisericia bacterium]|nr:valine--tRNA ligase [Caldisericia bacterium]